MIITITEYEMKDELTYINVPVLKYSIKYPQFSSREDSYFLESLNVLYRQKATAQARYCETELFSQAAETYNASVVGQYTFREYTLQIDYTVTLNQDCLLSFYFDRGFYAGGANAESLRSAYSWNVAASAPVELCQLYPGGKCVASVKDEISRQIMARLETGEGYFFNNWRELLDEYFNEKNFYLKPSALAVFFQETTIAPHASGTVVFEITYSNGPVKLAPCV